MKLTWMLIVVALGCSKKSNEPSKTAEPAKATEPAKPAPAAEPFKGTLTPDLVVAAKGAVKPLAPWAEGFAQLQAKLGPPTKVDGDKYEWAAMQGDDCAYTYVTKEDGKKYAQEGEVVGEVSTPMKVGKSDPPGNRSECLAILGKEDGPAEDPNAPAPPADGKVTVASLLDNAVKGRSKWKGKEVVVSGKLTQVSTSTSEGKTTTSIYVADPKDTKQSVSCTLDTGNAKLASGKPVTVKGTVAVDKAMNGKGETIYDVRLEHCAIAK
ncbi:MAG: hypothetical protein ACM31C_18075 [Acidobacteriota bacterium]